MKVKFVPQNIEVEATPEKSLLQIATENHIEIKSICKGVPSCAECRVRIAEGEGNVLPPNKVEMSLIGTNWRIDSRRLACQVHCFGDVTVDLTEQVERQETQSKKVRGFRSHKQVESHAVQDTMLLVEKPDERFEEKSGADFRESQPQGPKPGRDESRGPRPQGSKPKQKQEQKQKQNQNQKQKQNQNQNQRPKQGQNQSQKQRN